LSTWRLTKQVPLGVDTCVGFTAVVMVVLSRHEVSARQDAMTYLVRVRGLLVDGES